MATTSKGSAGATGDSYKLPSLDDLQQFVERFNLPGLDVGALVEWQRKDLEALAEAQRQAFEGLKAVVQRRNEILQESLAQWQEATKGAVGADALAKQSEAVQRGVEKAIESFGELAALESEAHGKSWKVLQDRLQENMANLQKLLQPK